MVTNQALEISIRFYQHLHFCTSSTFEGFHKLGTPKWSILIGFSLIKPSILGYLHFWKPIIFLQHVSSRNRPPTVFQSVPCWGSSLAAAFKERSTRLAMSGRVHGFLGLRWNFERTQIQKTMVYARKYDHICGFGSQHFSRTCMTKCRNQCEIFGYGHGE